MFWLPTSRNGSNFKRQPLAGEHVRLLYCIVVDASLSSLSHPGAMLSAMTATYTCLLTVPAGILGLQLRPFGVQQLEKIKRSFAVPQEGDSAARLLSRA